MTSREELLEKVEKIDHLLGRDEHDAGYEAFVWMRKVWPDIKAALVTPAQNENMALRGELNKALREIVDLRMPISGAAQARRGSMAAQWTYDPEAEAYYFAPMQAAPPPYLKQRHVDAIIDIAADGTLAGVELIDNMPPPPSPVSSTVRESPDYGYCTCGRHASDQCDFCKRHVDGGALPSTHQRATFCGLCDLEHQLHEDAQGFHHVIKGERVACPVPPADHGGAA